MAHLPPQPSNNNLALAVSSTFTAFFMAVVALHVFAFEHDAGAVARTVTGHPVLAALVGVLGSIIAVCTENAFQLFTLGFWVNLHIL